MPHWMIWVRLAAAGGFSFVLLLFLSSGVWDELTDAGKAIYGVVLIAALALFVVGIFGIIFTAFS